MIFKKNFRKRKTIFGAEIPNDFYDEIFKVIKSPSPQLLKENFIYFDNIKAYGTSKYRIVEKIMISNEFGITPIHTELNKIYFQEDDEKHLNNKKIALKYLDFLSKKQEENEKEYINKLIEKILSFIPKSQPFNAVKHFIRPLVFIKTFNDFKSLSFLKEFDPFDESFDYNTCVEEIEHIFEDRKVLEGLIKIKLDIGIPLPKIFMDIIANAQSNVDLEKEYLPKFITSMLFAGFESTSSFITSVFYFYFNEFKEKIDANNRKDVQEFMDEIVRLYVPTQVAFRLARKDCVFNKQKFKKGDLIILFLRFANMDSTVFENPEEIILGRKQQNLSFGKGRLACIGKYSAFNLGFTLLNNLMTSQRKIDIQSESAHYNDVGMRRIEELSIIIHDN